jgi:hypothetical protein
MGEKDNSDIGMITAVIMDAKNKPFVIVEKNGMEYALDASFTYMKGDALVFNGGTDTTKLPPWNENQLQGNTSHKLTGDQSITVATTTG